MAAIYAADVWCDDCADDIRRQIGRDLFNASLPRIAPDGNDLSDCDSELQLTNALLHMDERNYDSDEYPKYHSDDEESDCPQHCAAGADCLNAVECSNGSKYGYFFENDLTYDGVDYVKGAVYVDLAAGRLDSPAVEIWKEYYDWIDYDEEFDDGEDSD